MTRSGMVQFHADLDRLMVPIDEVQPHVDNYNNGDVEGIMDSIMANGMYRPIYVLRSTGEIVAGNHTWMACKELGAEQIPVIKIDATDRNHAIRIMIGDNEYARHARPDLGQEVALLEELKLSDSLLGSGVSEDQLLQLKALNELPLDPDDGSHMQWPTISFQVPPHVRKKFYDMTEMAGTDAERFMMLMKLAGWDGRR